MPGGIHSLASYLLPVGLLGMHCVLLLLNVTVSVSDQSVSRGTGRGL